MMDIDVKRKYLEIFREISYDVCRCVLDVYRTERASTSFGRGAGGDDTALIDVEAERQVIEYLKDYCEREDEGITLISEEAGRLNIGKIKDKPDCFIFIDPVDGSNNAKAGIPLFSLSIAAASGDRMGDVEVGYVKDIVGKAEFCAIKGEGAWVDGKSIKSLKINNMKLKSPEKDKPAHGGSIEYLAFHTGAGGAGFLEILNVIKNSNHVRCFGSIALTLCYVACGTIDAYVDFRPARLIDTTAARLIIEESGGFFYGYSRYSEYSKNSPGNLNDYKNNKNRKIKKFSRINIGDIAITADVKANIAASRDSKTAGRIEQLINIP